MCRRSERTRRAVERAGCEREPQSGRELDERLHGWPFCGDGEDASERGHPKDGTSPSVTEQGCAMQRGVRTEISKVQTISTCPPSKPKTSPRPTFPTKSNPEFSAA